MSKRYRWEEFSDYEQLYLRTVSEYFRQNGSWPIYKALERELRAKDDDFDFDETVKSIDAKFHRHPELYRWESTREAVLDVLILSICPGMDAELDAFTKMLRYCVDRYDNDDAASITVESTEFLVRLKMPQAELCKAAVLLKNEGIYGSFSGDPSGGKIMNWAVTIAENIRNYRNVRTIEQYIDKRYGQSENTTLASINEILDQLHQDESTPEEVVVRSRDVFVVHGHDEGARESVARYLEQLGLDPIILHEQANKGRTIIEKFEAHADVAYAVVLLTPDDIGTSKETASTLTPRARQNVILEWGYFVGKLGREKVCALYKPDVELPSDMSGLLWIAMDDAGAWKSQLQKELREASVLRD